MMTREPGPVPPVVIGHTLMVQSVGAIDSRPLYRVGGHVYPVGYRVVRVSFGEGGVQAGNYECSITDRGGAPLVRISPCAHRYHSLDTNVHLGAVVPDNIQHDWAREGGQRLHGAGMHGAARRLVHGEPASGYCPLHCPHTDDSRSTGMRSSGSRTLRSSG